MSKTFIKIFHQVIVISIIIALTISKGLYPEEKDKTNDKKPPGTKCVIPTFDVDFVGKDILEIDVSADEVEYAKFEVQLSEIPALCNTKGDSLIVLPKDTLTIINGKGTIYATPTNMRLLESEGRVMIKYRVISDTSKYCKAWNSGQCVGVATDKSVLNLYTGVLFNLNKTGKVNGNLEVDLSSYTRYLDWLSTFGEFQYTSIGAIDDSTMTDTKNIVNKFAEGGGVFNALVGLMFHGIPFTNIKYKEWETPVFSPYIGFGFRNFADEKVKDFFAYPRVELGLDINLIQFNAGRFGGKSGYIDIGYAYDKFWISKLEDSTGKVHTNFNEPNRLFLKANLDFKVNNILLAAFLSADLPANFSRTPMKLNFGIYAWTGLEVIGGFLTGFLDIFQNKKE